jgi:hypothetical protein
MIRAVDQFIKNNFSRIAEINRKYASPSIKMTKSVRITLLFLRLYLLTLVGLLVYKFITLLH